MTPHDWFTKLRSFVYTIVALFSMASMVARSEARMPPAWSSGEAGILPVLLPVQGDALHQLDAALKMLTARVSPAVVEILVSGFGGNDSDNSGNTAVVTRQQSVGSGVIVDPSGYIMTNAHVVARAERIEVLLASPRMGEAASGKAPVPLKATVIGVTKDFDLALLKVEASGLDTLPFADFSKVIQGQVVIAIGSPMGLENSVTMGVISSVARQADPATPQEYVQTDAPINPGNSGGALVDVDGRLVGINTFILSQAGGNEGLGFAVPAPIVQMVYEDLRQKGHVDRRTIGVGIQNITPTLAAALGLSRPSGLVICDVLPDGPAAAAGLKLGDIILEADGRSILTAPQLETVFYTHDLGKPLDLRIERGSSEMPVAVELVEQKHDVDSVLDSKDPEKNLVSDLGLLGVTVTPDMADSLGDLRVVAGVAVVARTTSNSDIDLDAGDVIHAVNNVPVTDIDGLRQELAKYHHGDSIALEIERDGGLLYVAFDKE